VILKLNNKSKNEIPSNGSLSSVFRDSSSNQSNPQSTTQIGLLINSSTTSQRKSHQSHLLNKIQSSECSSTSSDKSINSTLSDSQSSNTCSHIPHSHNLKHEKRIRSPDSIQDRNLSKGIYFSIKLLFLF
jgi:hypothetical protein